MNRGGGRRRLTGGGILGEASATLTLATGTVATVMFALADFPFADAAIAAVPGATAVISPELETVAMVVSDEDQAMVTSLTASPKALRGTAVACAVCPTVRLLTPNVKSMVFTEASTSGGVESDAQPITAAMRVMMESCMAPRRRVIRKTPYSLGADGIARLVSRVASGRADVR